MTASSRLILGCVLLSAVAVGCGKKPAPAPVDDADNTDARPPRPRPQRVEDPDAPFPDADAPAPKKKAAPAWGDGGIAVPLKHDSRVTFGPPGCPVVVVDRDVYEVKTFTVIRRLPDEYERYARRALSPDGRYFAVTKKGWNEEDTETYVYATDTGRKVLTAPPAAKEVYADFVGFFGSTHLLLGGRHGPVIDVWDVAGGKKVGGLTAPNRQVRERTVVLTPDGKYFATDTHDKLVVTETATNKQAAVMASPGKNPGGAAAGYASPEVMAFSPDGSELAAYSERGAPRLIVWNVKGQIVLDVPVPNRPTIANDAVLEWLPDGSGWLVNSHLIDRASRRPVLGVRVPFAAHVTPHLLDQTRVIGKFAGDDDALQVIPVPWPKLRAALKAVDDKADAYLAPGRPVALDFQLDGLRGDPAETRNVLGQALTKRLARDGIPVAAQAPTVLRLSLAEQAGDTLPIFEKQSPFDRRGRDTGRKATGAKGAATLELWAQGEAAPLWRGHLTAASGTSFREEINDATLRKSMLEGLGRQLDGIEVPYFIPKSKDVVALPAVID